MRTFARKRQRDVTDETALHPPRDRVDSVRAGGHNGMPRGSFDSGRLPAPRDNESAQVAHIVLPDGSFNHGRLARQDYGAMSLHLDDLEYALEGLTSPRASISVLRRSAVDILALCADKKQRLTLFHACGVLKRLVEALESVRSTDGLVSLATAAVLEHVTRDVAVGTVAQPLIKCLLRRLQLASSSSEASAAESATVVDIGLTSELWSLLSRFESNGLVSTRAQQPPSSDQQMRAATRRACVDALDHSSRVAACVEELRSQGALPVLLNALEVGASCEAALQANWEEVETSLQLIQTVTFKENGEAIETDDQQPSASLSHSGTPVDISTVLHVMSLASRALYSAHGTTAHPSPESASALASSETSAPLGHKQGRSASHSLSTSRSLDASRPAACRDCRTCGQPLNESRSTGLADSVGLVCDGGCGCEFGEDEVRWSCQSCDFDLCLRCVERWAELHASTSSECATSACNRNRRNRREACSSRNEDLRSLSDDGSPPAYDTTVMPAKALQHSNASVTHSTVGAVETKEREMLLHAVKAMVNLTNGSAGACEQLATSGLSVVAQLLASEFEGCVERGGLPHHYDTALMSLGLLANVLELCPQAQGAAGASGCLVHSAGKRQTLPLINVLSTALHLLLRPCQSVAQPEVMEREVTAAYTSLVVGFLCRGQRANCSIVLTTLNQDNFSSVADLLQSFLDLHAEAQLISKEGSNAMSAVIDWMRTFQLVDREGQRGYATAKSSRK